MARAGGAAAAGLPAGLAAATRERNRSMPSASAPVAFGSASSIASASARYVGLVSLMPDPPKPAVMNRSGIIPRSDADDAAAHRVAVNVGALDLQVIHQLDDVLGAARSARRRLVALAVIAVVDRDDAMALRDLRRDAGVEPHALRVVGVAVHEHDPRSANRPCVR